MTEAVIISLISAISVAIVAPIITALIDKSKRKSERKEKKEDTKSEWQKQVDGTLVNYNTRLDSISDELAKQKEIDKLLLKGTMLITGHLCDGNHTNDLRQFSKAVDEFLIEKQ